MTVSAQRRYRSRFRTSIAALAAMLALVLANLVPAQAQALSETPLTDGFERSSRSGWGAPSSGEYAPNSAVVASVASGTATLEPAAPGRTAVMTWKGDARGDVETRTGFRIPELPDTGSGVYFGSHVRVTDAASYAARVRVVPSGRVELALVRTAGTTTHVLEQRTVPVDVRDDAVLEVRAVGSDRVELQARVWNADEAVPEWQLAAAERPSAELRSGTAAWSAYSSSAGPALPVAISDVTVGAPVLDPAPTPEPAPGTPTAPAPNPSPGPAPLPQPKPLPQTETPTAPKPTPPIETPTAPAPQPDPGVAVRGTPGAAAPGTLHYPVPSGAVFVSPTGSDASAGARTTPLRTVTAALRAVPNGGTIVMRAGSYHEEVIVPPQKRVTIQPYPGEEVWFDGATPVTGWKASGKVWVKSGWDLELDPSPTYSRGKPDNTQPGWRFVSEEYPMAAHPDQVWVGGEKLRQVASRGEVVRGAFYVDRARDELVIGSDPSGRSVEASRLVQALSVRSDGSEVRGIGVRRYSPSVPDMGAVIAAAANVVFTDVTIRDAATTGFYSWSTGTTLRRVSLLDNGMLGGGAATADRLRLEGVLSMGNNSERFNRAPVSGAFKIGRSRDVSVIDSAFVGNFGQGPWFDESVYDIRFTGNDVIGNTGNGLVLEISEKAVVADNIVADNGLSGIYVINTGNAQIWNNTVVENTRNINITQDRRRASDPNAAGHDPRQPKPDPTMPWITRGTVVSNNVVGSPSGNCLVCVEDSSREFTAARMVASTDGNLYHRENASSPRWFGVWSRGPVVNPAVTDTLELFRSSTGQEQQSRLVEGAVVVTGDYRLRSAYASSQASVSRGVPASVASVSRLGQGDRVLGAQPR